MKKFLLLLAAACVCTCASAQQKVYCEILGHGKLFSKKLTITVDFGQDQWQNSKLVDENGKKMNFNSMIDAMNFMGKLGWEFEQAYVLTSGGGLSAQQVYHWLLSKYIQEGEAINEGIKTKTDYQQELLKEEAEKAPEEE